MAKKELNLRNLIISPLLGVPSDVAQKRAERKIKDTLESRKVPYESLVQKVEGVVKSVHGLREDNYNSVGEIRIGGHNDSIKTTSYTTKLSLRKSNRGVEIITFNGWPPIRQGDHITAYCLAADEHTDAFHDHSFAPDEFYIKRRLRKEEIAQKIEIHAKNQIIATYGDIQEGKVTLRK